MVMLPCCILALPNHGGPRIICRKRAPYLWPAKTVCSCCSAQGVPDGHACFIDLLVRQQLRAIDSCYA